MSYPFVGLDGILPEGKAWDAAAMEQLLRDGHHIFFEDEVGSIGRTQFKDGNFQFVRDTQDEQREELVAKETDSFLEFAAWCAFHGRDFL